MGAPHLTPRGEVPVPSCLWEPRGGHAGVQRPLQTAVSSVLVSSGSGCLEVPEPRVLVLVTLRTQGLAGSLAPGQRPGPGRGAEPPPSLSVPTWPRLPPHEPSTRALPPEAGQGQAACSLLACAFSAVAGQSFRNRAGWFVHVAWTMGQFHGAVRLLGTWAPLVLGRIGVAGLGACGAAGRADGEECGARRLWGWEAGSSGVSIARPAVPSRQRAAAPEALQRGGRAAAGRPRLQLCLDLRPVTWRRRPLGWLPPLTWPPVTSY